MQIANLCIGIYNACVLLIQFFFYLRSSYTTFKTNSGKAFVWFSVCTFMLVAGSILAAIPSESAGNLGRAAAIAGYIIYFCFVFIHILVFNIYLFRELFKTIWKPLFFIPSFACLLCITLCFISLANGCVFSVSSTCNLLAGNLYPCIMGIALALGLFDIVLVVTLRKKVNRKHFFALMLFPSFPCIGVLLGLLVPQMLLVSAASLFSLTLFFRSVLQRKLTDEMDEHLREIRAVGGTNACIFHWNYNVCKFYTNSILPEYAFEVEDGYLCIDKLINGGIAPQQREAARTFFGGVVQELQKAEDGASREFEFRDWVYRDQWRRAVVVKHADDEYEQPEIFMTFRDITYEKTLFSKNQAQRRRFNAVVTGIYLQIAEVDVQQDKGVLLGFHGAVVEEKPMEGKWSEYASCLLNNRVHPESRGVATALLPDAVLSMHENEYTCTYRLQIDGEYTWLSTTVRSFTDEDGARTLLYLTQNINDSIREHNRLKDASEHDFLTDLFNRTKYEAMLKEEYRYLNSCGVLFFDINRLKQVNDGCGHAAGDVLISMAADSIRSITNRRIHAYRYGGDEMLVILCNYPQRKLDEVLDFWRTRLDKLNKNSEIKCTMAVGKAWAEGDFSVEELVAHADSAMYQNKRLLKKKD